MELTFRSPFSYGISNSSKRLPRKGLLFIDTIPLTIDGQWIYLYY